MPLIADAEDAEDIADAFSKFKAPVPDHAPDITATISELYGISSVLREIDAARGLAEYSGNFLLIEENLDLVCSQLRQIIGHIFRILGEIGNGSRVLNDGMYRQTWKDITFFFSQNGQMTLRTCLEKYKRSMMELADIVKRRAPKMAVVGYLRHDIQGLVPKKDRLTEALNTMPPGATASLTRRRSYERDRPINLPSLETHVRENSPPSVPEVPVLGSPSSATQMTSSGSSTCSESEHWATKVFRETSTTPLTTTGDISRCYGDHNPEARIHLKEEFQEVFEIFFGEQSKLTVRLYYRERDNRAWILCKWPRSCGRGSKYSCLPLNALEFRRSESSLQICKKRYGCSKLDPWASLNFSTIERMVVFYCAVLSLRGQDAGKPVTNIQDYELDGEAVLFGGKIDDDNYLHALRVYRDRDTKAVRLQASVHRGEMERTPVWTAFITHYLVSDSWLHRASRTLVYLRELKPHVFSSEYTPQVTARGEHVLKFTSEADADAFVRTIEDLARRYARKPAAVPPPPPPGFRMPH